MASLDSAIHRRLVTIVPLLIATAACADEQPQAEPLLGQRHETLQISVSPVLPIDARNPKVVITYFNAGKRPLEITLPHVESIPFYRRIKIRIDERDPRFAREVDRDDDLKYKGYFIKPGTKKQLEVSLRTIYKTPDRWFLIEIEVSAATKHEDIDLLSRLTLMNWKAGGGKDSTVARFDHSRSSSQYRRSGVPRPVQECWRKSADVEVA